MKTSDKVFAKAVSVFGETFDPREAGYVLPDGTMLDFSGKNEGGPAGHRAFDHRDIWRALPSVAQKRFRTSTDSMLYFMRLGAVRWGMYSGSTGRDFTLSISVASPLTYEQDLRLRECAEFTELIVVDVGNSKGDTIESREFSPTEVRFIKDYVEQKLSRKGTKKNPIVGGKCYDCGARVGASHKAGCYEYPGVVVEAVATVAPMPATPQEPYQAHARGGFHTPPECPVCRQRLWHGWCLYSTCPKYDGYKKLKVRTGIVENSQWSGEEGSEEESTVEALYAYVMDMERKAAAAAKGQPLRRAGTVLASDFDGECVRVTVADEFLGTYDDGSGDGPVTWNGEVVHEDDSPDVRQEILDLGEDRFVTQLDDPSEREGRHYYVAHVLLTCIEAELCSTCDEPEEDCTCGD